MSQKKRTKRLRRALVEQFADWLAELSKEQLASLRVQVRHQPAEVHGGGEADG